MSEFVTPYAGEPGQEVMCDSCDQLRTIGLKIREGNQFTYRSEVKGFICIYCIAQMWNTPATTPHEPSADERTTQQISETSVEAELPEEFFTGAADEIITEKPVAVLDEAVNLGSIIEIKGRKYRVVHSQNKDHYYGLQAVTQKEI